jgi:SAM-dependent methyltransferase
VGRIGTKQADPTRPRRADVADSYDRGVGAYEALWSPVILPPADALVTSLGLAGRCVIADVGAGTGALLGAIRAAAPAARVAALDTSAEMLHVARTSRGVPAILADALAIPLADETADAVILAYVLFHLADPARAVAEAARVLRPGGQVGTNYLGVGAGLACRHRVGSDPHRRWRATGPAAARRFGAGHTGRRGCLADLGRAAATTSRAAPAPPSMGPVIVLEPGHRLGRQPGPAQPHRC